MGESPIIPTTDHFGRPLQCLRISVTDRCNLRCRYCMPEAEYQWIPRGEILSFEEILRVARLFRDLGVRKLRLTGGEPLLRRDLPDLVALLAARGGAADLSLTTNGLLLAEAAGALRAAGLHRVTVSLDTLHADRFARLTGSPGLARALEGIAAARAAGLPLKLNAVVMRGVNDDEIAPLVAFAKSVGAEMRFIEYMDVGGATEWSGGQVVSRAEIIARVEAVFGPATPHREGDGRAPAERFVLADGTRFGVIASTTAPFCGTCDRARLTADGVFLTCLYAHGGLALREALRGGVEDATLRERIAACWRGRTDRGAEQRLRTPERSVFVPLAQLRDNPHLEMHTRGG